MLGEFEALRIFTTKDRDDVGPEPHFSHPLLFLSLLPAVRLLLLRLHRYGIVWTQ
jgi:hypothetical protein